MKQERAAKEKMNELELRRQLMERYERDEKLEQLSNQQKRLSMIKHKKDVEEIITERKRLREIEAQKEVEMERMIKDSEKEREEVIRAERLRLIALHAPKLKHYLNTKIATNQEEMDIIGKYIE